MRGSFQHETLLRACLSETAKEFEVQVRAWEKIQPMEDIDYASMRLIPYLYKQSLRFDVELKDNGICKGLYLRSWYTIQVKTAMPQRELGNLGFLSGCLILKGAALQQSIYKEDPPTRPADDIDVLIPLALKNKGMTQLIASGFKLEGPFTLSTILTLRNSANLYKGASNVDLHWSIFPICRDPEFHERLVSRATPSTQAFLTPSATDNLIHTLVHGYGSNSIAPIRWVLDAVLLIRSGEIDWTLFNQEVEATGWSELVSHQFKYLKETFAIDAPSDLHFRPSNSYLMWIGRKYLRTNSLWVRRALRLIGWDFAVLATNFGLPPTLKNYFKLLPLHVRSFTQELQELLQSRRSGPRVRGE
jgi:hypothetical protein